jgi:hypothetical protein
VLNFDRNFPPKFWGGGGVIQIRIYTLNFGVIVKWVCAGWGARNRKKTQFLKWYNLLM